jgi:hypothetical protein
MPWEDFRAHNHHSGGPAEVARRDFPSRPTRLIATTAIGVANHDADAALIERLAVGQPGSKSARTTSVSRHQSDPYCQLGEQGHHKCCQRRSRIVRPSKKLLWHSSFQPTNDGRFRQFGPTISSAILALPTWRATPSYRPGRAATVAPGRWDDRSSARRQSAREPFRRSLVLTASSA